MPRSMDFIEDYHRLLDRVRRLEMRTGDVPHFVTYSISGDLAVQNGGLRWYAPFDGMIKKVYVSVGTAPSGSGVHIRLNKNGIPIGTIIIAAGTNYDWFSPDDPDFVDEDFFTVDVTAVGSSTPGSNLVVQLKV